MVQVAMLRSHDQLLLAIQVTSTTTTTASSSSSSKYNTLSMLKTLIHKYTKQKYLSKTILQLLWNTEIYSYDIFSDMIWGKINMSWTCFSSIGYFTYIYIFFFYKIIIWCSTKQHFTSSYILGLQYFLPYPVRHSKIVKVQVVRFRSADQIRCHEGDSILAPSLLSTAHSSHHLPVSRAMPNKEIWHFTMWQWWITLVVTYFVQIPLVRPDWSRLKNKRRKPLSWHFPCHSLICQSVK